MSPPGAVSAQQTVLAAIQITSQEKRWPAKLAVRDEDGSLIRTVGEAEGRRLVEAGQAEPIGARAVKYLRLREALPSSVSLPEQAANYDAVVATKDGQGRPRKVRFPRPDAMGCNSTAADLGLSAEDYQKLWSCWDQKTQIDFEKCPALLASVWPPDRARPIPADKPDEVILLHSNF